MNFITTPYEIHDLDKLKRAGSDSVIISCPFFSARGTSYVEVGELKEYRKACDKLKLEMYVMVNRFFTEEELPLLRDFLRLLKQLPADGIYFGDESVLYYAEELQMKDKLIYSPDTLMTNAQDVLFYLEEGIRMVTLSKEITLKEILTIADHTDPSRLEVIIHGRQNMMHSKRQLVSSYLDFIHQPRDVKGRHDLYLMEENREEHMPIIEDELGTHVFSGFTLASFQEIKALNQHGIANVRLDGIFLGIDKLCQALTGYESALYDADSGRELMEDYQKCYPEDHYTSGFYYTKTSKTKGR